MHFCKHRLEIVSNASGDFPSPLCLPSSSSSSSCSPLPHSYSDKQPPLSREQSRSLARNYSQFPGFEHFPVKVSFFPFPSLLNCLPFSVYLSLSLFISESSISFLLLAVHFKFKMLPFDEFSKTLPRRRWGRFDEAEFFVSRNVGTLGLGRPEADLTSRRSCVELEMHA